MIFTNGEAANLCEKQSTVHVHLVIRQNAIQATTNRIIG